MFITPFIKKYTNKRLPMGISSAPEIYYQKMAEILQDLEGTLNLMNDICIYGSTQEEHDDRLHKVLSHLVKTGVTFNTRMTKKNKEKQK